VFTPRIFIGRRTAGSARAARAELKIDPLQAEDLIFNDASIKRSDDVG
jgi:hypothetical protein